MIFEYGLGLCHKTFEILIELFERSFKFRLLLRMKILRLKIIIVVVPWSVFMISPNRVVDVGAGIMLINYTNCWPKGLHSSFDDD